MAHCKNYNPCDCDELFLEGCPHAKRPKKRKNTRNPVDIKFVKHGQACARRSYLTIGDMQHGDIFGYASLGETAYHNTLYRCVSNNGGKVTCVELGGYTVHTFGAEGCKMSARRWSSVTITANGPVTTKR